MARKGTRREWERKKEPKGKSDKERKRIVILRDLQLCVGVCVHVKCTSQTLVMANKPKLTDGPSPFIGFWLLWRKMI